MIQKLKVFFRGRKDVKLAYLFGSRAKGAETSSSDFDIAVLLKETFPAENRLDFKLALINELKKALKNEHVDLVILNNASPLLKYQVVRHGTLLFSASDLIPFHYKAKVLCEYLDVKPMLDFFTKDAIRKIKELP